MNSHDGRDPAFPGKRKNRRSQAAVDIVEMDDVRALFVQNACKGIRRTAAMDSFARGTQSPIVPVACALTLSANSPEWSLDKFAWSVAENGTTSTPRAQLFEVIKHHALGDAPHAVIVVRE